MKNGHLSNPLRKAGKSYRIIEIIQWFLFVFYCQKNRPFDNLIRGRGSNSDRRVMSIMLFFIYASIYLFLRDILPTYLFSILIMHLVLNVSTLHTDKNVPCVHKVLCHHNRLDILIVLLCKCHVYSLVYFSIGIRFHS